MMNAKREFLYLTEDCGLICAKVQVAFQQKTIGTFLLKQNYTEPELQEFLSGIDFTYNDESCPQKLFGTVWHTGDIWSERQVFGDCEYWERRDARREYRDFKNRNLSTLLNFPVPPIPDDLL